MGRLAGPGDGRLPAPVHRPQPDARGRVRDRGPAGHAWPTSSPRSCRSSAPSTRSRPPPGCGRSARPRRAPTSTSSRCARGTSGSSSARPRTTITWPTVAGVGALARGRGRAARPRSSECPTTARSSSRPRSATASATGSSWPAASSSGSARSVARHGDAHAAQRARADARGGRAAAAAGPARADPAEHEDLARPAGRGAAPQGPERHLLPLRGSRLHRPRRSTSGSTTSSAA